MEFIQELMDNLSVHTVLINITIGIILIIILFCLITNVNYFNVLKIIKNYIGLFKERDNKFNFGAISLAFIVPILLAIVVSLSNLDIPTNTTNDFPNSITINGTNEQDGATLVITILTAMFFTILGFVLDINSKIESSKKTATDKARLKKLSDSIYYANMFEILMCIIILILSFINSFTDNFVNIINFFIYWVTFTVVINMLMLLKRLYIVFNELIK